jgi:hypothetical protein
MCFGDWLRPRPPRLHEARARRAARAYASGYVPTEARIAAAPFPVERARVRSDASLPLDAGRCFRHDGAGVLAQRHAGVTEQAV